MRAITILIPPSSLHRHSHLSTSWHEVSLRPWGVHCIPFFFSSFGRPGRLVKCGLEVFLFKFISDSPLGGFGKFQSGKKITSFEGVDACVRRSFFFFFFYFRLGG